jgi:hypothetical protein
MSALYAIWFSSVEDVSMGALYIGKGKIVGIDAGNIRYYGTYGERGRRIKVTGTLSAPERAMLVTGRKLAAGQSLQFTADWPSNFANGKPQRMTVAGSAVSVTFEKIGDVP